MQRVFASVHDLRVLLQGSDVALFYESSSRVGDNIEIVADLLHARLSVEPDDVPKRHTSLGRLTTQRHGSWRFIRQCSDVAIAATTSVHGQPSAVAIARIPAAIRISR